MRALTLDRFTGLKHSLLFTRRERRDILTGATLVDRQIREALAYSYNGLPHAFAIEETFIPFLLAVLRGLPIRPVDIDLVVTSNSHFGWNSGRIGNLLNDFFPNARIVNSVEHHAVHQWQTFLPSTFERAAILTADESGESLARIGHRKIAMTLAVGTGDRIETIFEHFHPNSSPGLLYADISRHIGYYAGEEGKTMGLSAYGRDHIYQELRPHLTLNTDGSFAFLELGDMLERLYCHAERRSPKEPVLPVHADIAYAGQRLIEDIMDNAMTALSRMVPSDIDAVCLAGGVALNGCANEKMFRNSRFSRLYVCPNAGDDGHAVGLALYGARVLMGSPEPTGLPHDYLGPPVDAANVRASLLSGGHVPEQATPNRIAALLADGVIVGLYQGGAEFGPRALGNRSILADPRDEGMAIHVNAEVKHRELFRPYAPVVPIERAGEWFELDDASPFMLRVVQVRERRRHLLGAVTHIDGTARIQTLERAANPLLYDTILGFERITGVPVLMNTSFNLAGKPIVESLDDVLDCYQNTGMGALVAADALLVKSGGFDAAPRGASARETQEMQEYLGLCAHAKQ